MRAGNVIGGGDWSEDRLVPDVVRAISQGRKLVLRYPNAVRPWQHVLDPLSGYLTLAEQLIRNPANMPAALNFGPDPGHWLTVAQVADVVGQALEIRIKWELAPGKSLPEAATLTLSSDLAKRVLGWAPLLMMQETVDWTADWYKAHQAGRNIGRRHSIRSPVMKHSAPKNRSYVHEFVSALPLLQAPLRATLVDLGRTPLANSYLAPEQLGGTGANVSPSCEIMLGMPSRAGRGRRRAEENFRALCVFLVLFGLMGGACAPLCGYGKGALASRRQ